MGEILLRSNMYYVSMYIGIRSHVCLVNTMVVLISIVISNILELCVHAPLLIC